MTCGVALVPTGTPTANDEKQKKEPAISDRLKFQKRAIIILLSLYFRVSFAKEVITYSFVEITFIFRS